MKKQRDRTLIIDGQMFQSFTFHRGMGKYSLSFLEALNSKLSMYANKILLFNTTSDYLSDAEMATIKSVAKGFTFEFLDLKTSDVPGVYATVRDYNRRIVDEYVNTRCSGQSIDYMILSLFQENEVATFPTHINNRYLLVYDLIPLLFFYTYLKVDEVAQNYLSRFDILMEADHFFTISRSVAIDLSLHLGIPKKRITPIYGAPIKRRSIAQTEISELKNRRIILLPSGDDYRKNNQQAVEAFEKFNKSQKNKYSLVITSAFTEATRLDLETISKNIIFVGNVSESELAWLYEQAHLVFFPTMSEGLGLPILEAIEFGKKIVCSDIPVFKEVHSSMLNFCDPYKLDDIVRALKDAIRAVGVNKKAYGNVLKRYSWQLTAASASAIFAKNEPNGEKTQKMKVAIFSPKPSGFSGIGKVVQEQHYNISRIADVTYYFEDGVTDRAKETEIRKNYLAYAGQCRDPWSFNEDEFNSFDQVIYHVGNGEYHVATLIKALAFPDQVVLHDTRIKGLYSVARDLGIISQKRYEAEELLTSLQYSPHGDFLVGLVNKQKRIITHSEYSKKAVTESLVGKTSVNVITTQLAIAEVYSVEFNRPNKTVYVSMAGLMTESKGIDLANKITRIKLQGYTFNVKIFGFSMLTENIVRTLTKNKKIELIQSPSDSRYLYELSQAHIMLNFRSPYHGETSYSTLEGLRFGKDVIVNNMGWFYELPNELVHKLNSSDEIIETLKKVAQVTGSKEIGRRRANFIESDYSIEKYVDRLVDNKRKI